MKSPILGGIFDPEGTANKLALLEARMAEPNFWNNPQDASACTKEAKELNAFQAQWCALIQETEELRDLTALFGEESAGAERRELIGEYERLQARFQRMRIAAFLDGEYDREGAFLSIHAGAGGTESCDWAQMLLRMYQRWCERRGYNVETRDIQGAEGGLKSVTLEIGGLYGYGYLRGESGVHRLVRISPFDSNGRRHTSFASVHVIPVFNEEIELQISADELRIDTYRASGAGGQHVNKTDSAVRITHLKTGIVAQCQSERSQHTNKENAMRILRARLYQHLQEEQRAKRDAAQSEKKEIAWGSQIRSYIFHPYKMAKDHRFDLESGRVDAIMDGEIDPFIEGFLLNK